MSDAGKKVFNDPVHGPMGFPALCVKIIDTPQFQRLRYLKQLGTAYFVYPGASHNRFEHCLGTCHLAGKLIKMLKRRQPDLKISPDDILCVQIAGLCHDLGHGPFSHTFERFVKDSGRDWKHENATLALFDYMVETNDLKKDFEDLGITDDKRKFIKELILGEKPKDQEESTFYRKPEKKFLYEIVANKRTGVDVDKFDYFLRDCHHLGISNSFDYRRYMEFCRVMKVPEEEKEAEWRICVRDKEAFNMYDLFRTRHTLHRRAYQHKTVHAIEVMLLEALKKADPFITFLGADGEEYAVSQCVDRMECYTKLNDTIFHRILLTEDWPEEDQNQDLKDARKILKDIEKRSLYRLVDETKPIYKTLETEEQSQIKEELLDKMSDRKAEMERLKLTPGSSKFEVKVVNLDFGKGKANPVDNIHFFKKTGHEDPEVVKAEEVSCMLPQTTFKEQIVRVFLCLDNDTDDRERTYLLRTAMDRWFQDKQKESGDSTDDGSDPPKKRKVEGDKKQGGAGGPSGSS